MFAKYPHNSCTPDLEILYDWANNHKTTIILNGGYANNLWRLFAILANISNPYPWASFNESDEALNGCITSVGIILPKKVYEGARYVNSTRMDTYSRLRNITDFELEIMKELSQCNLMT
jgi:hypothetical protein